MKLLVYDNENTSGNEINTTNKHFSGILILKHYKKSFIIGALPLWD